MKKEVAEVLVLAMRQRVRREGECLVWTGTIASSGYPQLTVKRTRYYVHRLIKEWATGQSVEGLHVHHECHNKHCVLPEHLAVLSSREHFRLHHPPAEECVRGHSLKNAYIRKDNGCRVCRACQNIRQRKDPSLPRPRNTWSKPPVMRGESHPGARLNADAVREIRRVAAEAREPGRQRFPRGAGVVNGLARRFGVSSASVQMVIRGATWTHVKS